MDSIRLGHIDYAILIVYTLFVLGIGFALKRYMKTSTDFFLSGRSIPAWIAALAFVSANLGANEVIGMGACGAKYGMMTCHFYWLGAVAAMVFVGVFMMPFYYGSKARSVPEYLKLRFDEKTRGFNAVSFAVMTIFQSGISMYAMAKLMQLLLNWDFNVSLWVSAAVVLVYITLGGLTSAIYNEVLQFFLIALGFLPLVVLGLYDVGGWTGLKAKLTDVAAAAPQHYPPGAWTSVWANMGDAASNPMHVEWFGMVAGLGFVLAFGYWCTDFTIAGADKKFVPAVATVDGDSIVVYSDQVAKPVAARYAWREDATPNLANKEGLPASPFRTDRWKGVTEGPKGAIGDCGLTTFENSRELTAPGE